MSEDAPVTPPAAPAEKPVEHHDEHVAAVGEAAVHATPAPTEHHVAAAPVEHHDAAPMPVEHHDEPQPEAPAEEAVEAPAPEIVRDSDWDKQTEQADSADDEPADTEVVPVEQSVEPEPTPEVVEAVAGNNSSPYRDFYNINPERVSQMPTGEFMDLAEKWLEFTRQHADLDRQLDEVERNIKDIEAKVRGDDTASESVAETAPAEPVSEETPAATEEPASETPRIEVTTLTPAVSPAKTDPTPDFSY